MVETGHKCYSDVLAELYFILSEVRKICSE